MVSMNLFYTDKYRLNKIIKIKNISGWINKLFEIIKAQPSYVFNTCPYLLLLTSIHELNTTLNF
jgi:hypothetical protein